MAYNSGYFLLYDIVESDDVASVRELSLRNESKWYFNELSVSDRLRSTLEAYHVDVSLKIRIPQYRGLDSRCVLKIGDGYYKVYNCYHGKDNDGNYITDITLTNWEDI